MIDPLRANERREEPGGARKLVLSQGKPFIHLSKDRTEIVTEHPDGRIEREPLKNPVPERRPIAPKENVRPKGADRS